MLGNTADTPAKFTKRAEKPMSWIYSRRMRFLLESRWISELGQPSPD
jgi:hypothetical protein